MVKTSHVNFIERASSKERTELRASLKGKVGRLSDFSAAVEEPTNERMVEWMYDKKHEATHDHQSRFEGRHIPTMRQYEGSLGDHAPHELAICSSSGQLEHVRTLESTVDIET